MFLAMLVYGVLLFALRGGAAPSTITGSQDGVLKRRCLDESHKPILGHSEGYAMIEETGWASNYIVSAIAGIIIREHIGYPVIFNKVDEFMRAFERPGYLRDDTLYKDAHDGEQLKNELDSKQFFYYMNFEAYGGLTRKEASKDKFLKKKAIFLGIGNLGFDSRDGWYLPAWMAHECPGMIYMNYLESNESNSSFQRVFEAMQRSGETFTCTSNGTSGNIWCPRRGQMMKLRMLKEYSYGDEQLIIRNNNLAMYVENFESKDAYWAFIDSALSGGGTGLQYHACGKLRTTPAFLAYMWEPSVASAHIKLERLFLPGRQCGRRDHGNLKCDFAPDPLAKVGSANILKYSPLLKQLLDDFRIEDIESLLQRFGSENPSSDEIWNVSCAWVRNNKEIWMTWSPSIKHLSWWTEVGDPGAFLRQFLILFLLLVFLCFLNDSLFFPGVGIRKEKVFGWPRSMEIGLPLVPMLTGCAKCSSSKVAPIGGTIEEVASPGGCFFLWASHCFFGSFEKEKLSVCLLRFGNVEGRALVYLSTKEGTMKAGKPKHMPTFEGFEHRNVVFEPGQVCAWIDIKLVKGSRWAPALKFTVMVIGKNTHFRGSRSAACIAFAQSGEWPCFSTHKSIGAGVGDRSDLSVAERFRFSLSCLKECMLHHGKFEEFLRILYTITEAIYDTAVSNWLFNVYVLRECIAEENYNGLLLVAAIHGFVICFKRNAKWKYLTAGTLGLRMHTKNMVSIKFCEPFQHLGSNATSKARLISMHSTVVDNAFPRFYLSIYGMFKSVLCLIVAIVYLSILKRSQEREMPSGSQGFYAWTMYTALIVTCTYSGVFRALNFRDKTNKELAMTYDRYTDVIETRSRSVELIHCYGPSVATSTAAQMYTVGYLPYVCALARQIFYNFDIYSLMVAFSDSSYTSAMVVLALVAIQSKFYGSQNFDTSRFLSSLALFKSIAARLMKFCTAGQAYVAGFVDMQNLHRFLNAPTFLEQMWNQQTLAFDDLNLQGPLTAQDLSLKFEKYLRIKFPSGIEIQLGGAYLLMGLEKSIPRKVFEFESKAVPSCCRVLHLHSTLPITRMNFEDVFEDVLFFAEPGRFTRADVEALFKILEIDASDFNDGLQTHLAQDLLGQHTRKNLDYVQDLDSSDHMFLDNFFEKKLQLAQAILSDPDVIIMDNFFNDEGVVIDDCGPMLKAALAWQKGGPRALMNPEQADEELKHVSAAPWFRPWMCPDGGLARTLLLNPSKEVFDRFDDLISPLSKIIIAGPLEGLPE